MGLYDKYLNLPKIQFSEYTSSIPKLDYTTNSAEIPILETFDPNAGRSEAFSNFINNNNFRNLRRAKRKFNELWNADEGYRRLLFDSSLNTNKLIKESQERVNKGGYFDDISEESAKLDAIDYRNAGWTQNPDGTWSQPVLKKPRLVPRLESKPKLIHSNSNSNFEKPSPTSVELLQTPSKTYTFNTVDNGSLSINNYSKGISENDLNNLILTRYLNYYRKVKGYKPGLNVDAGIFTKDVGYNRYKKYIKDLYKWDDLWGQYNR